jgi:antitoxin component of MazEF toxin-antitoxin module
MPRSAANSLPECKLSRICDASAAYRITSFTKARVSGSGDNAKVLVAITGALERFAGGSDGIRNTTALTVFANLAYIQCMDKPVSEAHPYLSEAYPLPPGVVAGDGDFVKLASDDFDALVMQDARVPSAIAKRIALEDGAAVEMAVDHGILYVRKASSRALADLIERITPENMHEPIFDEPTGAKRW